MALHEDDTVLDMVLEILERSSTALSTTCAPGHIAARLVLAFIVLFRLHRPPACHQVVC